MTRQEIKGLQNFLKITILACIIGLLYTMLSGCGFVCRKYTQKIDSLKIEQANQLIKLQANQTLELENLKEEYNKELAVQNLQLSNIIDNKNKELKKCKDILQEYKKITTEKWKVSEGECLSYVADVIFDKEEYWPIIYWDNKTTIKHYNLIYPDQMLIIDRYINKELIEKAIQFHKKEFP